MSLTISCQLEVETDDTVDKKSAPPERFVLLAPQLAAEIERARIEADLSTAEMLLALREQREKYVTERYLHG